MALYIQQVLKVSEPTAALRRVFMSLVQFANGKTPILTEGGGQPQISINGAAFVNTTATITHIGLGVYYVELTCAELAALGHLVVTYSSVNIVSNETLCAVAIDPYDEGWTEIFIECGYPYPS